MSATKRHRPGFTEKELVSSIKAAYWLSDSDRGAVQVARDLAAQIDALKQSQPPQGSLIDHQETVAGKVAYVSAQLQRLLNDLGLTAKGRRDLGFSQDEREENPLDKLRGTVVNLAAVRTPDAQDRDAGHAGS